MSVSKPFVFALVCEVLGAEAARRRLGVNATGLKFNSLAAIERSGDGRTNPMVNPGAIAATSLAPGSTVDEQWRFILDGLSRFAGRALKINDAVFASAIEWQSAQPGDRPIASRLRAGRDRPRRCGRPLYAAMLAQRDRKRPRRHGRDARRRRRQSANEDARDRRRELQMRAGGDGDGGPLRNLGRLALRRRTAGQERDRRRHRRRFRPARADLAPSLRGSTTPATASRGSSPPATFRSCLGLSLFASTAEI